MIDYRLRYLLIGSSFWLDFAILESIYCFLKIRPTLSLIIDHVPLDCLLSIIFFHALAIILLDQLIDSYDILHHLISKMHSLFLNDFSMRVPFFHVFQCFIFAILSFHFSIYDFLSINLEAIFEIINAVLHFLYFILYMSYTFSKDHHIIFAIPFFIK